MASSEFGAQAIARHSSARDVSHAGSTADFTDVVGFAVNTAKEQQIRPSGIKRRTKRGNCGIFASLGTRRGWGSQAT
jgi:hypothetical protein